MGVIYYASAKSFNSGMITFLSNRVGDSLIIIRVPYFMILPSANTMDLFYFSDKPIIIAVIVTLASFTKSAQIPFRAWLPAAMAAPTPVSALVHSSTLVTAGVYLLIRINILLNGIGISNILMVIGTFTIFMAGCAAMLEIDIKKVIALSTLSQLGIIIIIIGAGAPILAYFHLLSHAFFKAILFICAGMIIHNIKDYQDIRKIGLTTIF